MYKVLTVSEQKEVKRYSELLLLDIRKTPVVEWLERFPYLVFVQWGEQAYQFDHETGKFYMDVRNNEAMAEQQEEHTAIIEEMQKEGKTEEEIKEFIAGKGTVFFDRVECKIIAGSEDISDRVKNLIQYI